LDNNEFVTTNLVSEVEIQSAANAIAEFFKNTASNQIILFLNYIRTFTQANYIISALNTNMVSTVVKGNSDILTFPPGVKVRRSTTEYGGVGAEYNQSTNGVPQSITLPKSRFSRATAANSGGYGIFRAETLYIASPTDYASSLEDATCGNANPTSPAGFFSTSAALDISDHVIWDIPTANSEVVNGFFGGCTPLEALLPSTLDCLYDIECLQLLIKYFPALSQVCMTLF
jgi:hypothetical protein